MPEPINAKRYFATCTCIWAVFTVFAGVILSLDAFKDSFFVSKKMILAGISSLIAFGSVVIFILGKKTRWKPEFVFLGCFITLAVASISLMPFTTPDAQAQFYRAYEISQGKFITKVDQYSKTESDTIQGVSYFDGDITVEGYDEQSGSYLETLINSLNRTVDNGKVTKLSYTNMSSYSPIGFLPSALGILAARIISDSFWLQVYFARIFNLTFAGVVLFFCVKYMPVNKNLIIYSCFSPTLVELYSSMSPDVVVFATCVALITYICILREGTRNANPIVLTILCLCLALEKIVYLPLCGLIYLIPVSSYPSKRKYLLISTGVVLLSIAVNLAWLRVASTYLIEYNKGVDAHAQVSGILSNPARYAYTCIFTALTYGDGWIRELGGSFISSADGTASPYVLSLLFIIVYSSLLFDGDGVKQTFFVREKMYIGVIIFINVLLIFTSLYVQWTAAGSSIIDGIQGRYFLPLVPIATLIVVSNTRQPVRSSLWTFVIGINLCILIPAFSVSY